ncbi:MAG: transposase [Nostoc indistinguendum CM1-VF10]|nr:transposase [Nostoc indistinguendum CM1-VF10]
MSFPPGERPSSATKGWTPDWTWRELLEAMFWLLRTGSQWSALPECFPPEIYRESMLSASGQDGLLRETRQHDRAGTPRT